MKIYLDTSKIDEMLDAYENNKLIKGFTTNPSLMRKAGVSNYNQFIKDVTNKITDLPISFEIFADDFPTMEYQVEKLADFAPNIYVKIPVMNTQGIPTYELIRKMSAKGIKINVTAVFTGDQVWKTVEALNPEVPSVTSVFCGRIADTGIDPHFTLISVKDANTGFKKPLNEILWASVREIYNLYEAQKHADIITVPPDIINKYIKLRRKNLEEFSRETVQMFFDDSTSSGFVL